MFQLIIDELHICNDDKEQIKVGKRSKFAELLEYLKGKCEKSVIVVSSSSVIDRTLEERTPGFENDMTSDHLTEVIQSSGYNVVTLEKVMRNTSSITHSVTADSWNSYHRQGAAGISLSIPSGQSSTVTGHKPTAIIYKWSPEVDYRVLGECVTRYIADNPHIKDTRLAILCDGGISVRALKIFCLPFFPDMKCYDAGVEIFEEERLVFSDNTDNSDEDGVIKWLEEGGTLLTYSQMFRGCEAESVIAVYRFWNGGAYENPRSAVTRGVANMCIITSDYYLRTIRDDMKNNFKVIKHS